MDGNRFAPFCMLMFFFSSSLPIGRGMRCGWWWEDRECGRYTRGIIWLIGGFFVNYNICIYVFLGDLWRLTGDLAN